MDILLPIFEVTKATKLHVKYKEFKSKFNLDEDKATRNTYENYLQDDKISAGWDLVK